MRSNHPLPNRCCSGPFQRREFLRAGLLGAGVLSLPDLFRLRAAAGAAPRSGRTAVIVVFLQGGASHLETYDPKLTCPQG